MDSMTSVPGLKKYASCGICDIFTMMSSIDDQVGFVCDDCRWAVMFAENKLLGTKGIRAPRRGDMLPSDELL